jgi:hypothetical protein
MDDLPVAAEDEAPPFAPRLDETVAKARIEGVCRTGKLVEGVAHALPRELKFLRAPLASVAHDLGDLFDARISFSDQGLTFEAWDPELKAAAGLQQHLVDTRFKSNWWMTPATYFLGILLHKPYREAFAKRGIDAKQLLDDMVAALPPPPKWTRERPDAVTPSIAPHLYALFLRAERYAAEDASDVRLRHALAALHDERELALWVERLAA